MRDLLTLIMTAWGYLFMFGFALIPTAFMLSLLDILDNGNRFRRICGLALLVIIPAAFSWFMNDAFDSGRFSGDYFDRPGVGPFEW